jgi:NAD(P)-dependent dehydrogenase (short-subunit alcohol dehydrogenase family)
MKINHPAMYALILVVSVLSAAPVTAAFPDNAEGKKAVLITGASTGIGRLAAETFAGAGHLVYAGARKPADIEALSAIENIQGIRLDVTSQTDIDDAVETVRRQEHGLWGLVNNAGINRIDPLIEADMDDMSLLFDVNVLGVVRVTKAFAPLLIESGGRVAVVSSISGVLAGLPAYGGYAMTKHAIEAYIDQLAVELGMLGVKVSGIEPGNFRSQIGMTRCKLIVSKARSYKYYSEVMQPHFDYCKKRVETNAESRAPEPEPVAKAIAHALFDDKPLEHYLVTSDPFESEIVMRKLFERVQHFNLGNKPPYSRERLLEMFDDEGAIARGEKERPRYD